MGRIVTPINIKLRGNREKALQKINRAKALAGQLRAMLGPLPQGRKRWTLADGAIIDIIYHFGQYVAIIDVTGQGEELPPYVYCFYVRVIATAKKYQVTYFNGQWIAREHTGILGGFTWFAPDGSTVCYGALGSSGVPGISVDNQLFGDQFGTFYYVAAWRGPDGILRGVRATSYQSPPTTFRRRLELYRVTAAGITLLDTLDFQTIIGGSSVQGFATVSADRSRMIYSHFTAGNDTHNAIVGISSDSNSLSYLGQANVAGEFFTFEDNFVHTVVTTDEYETNVGNLTRNSITAARAAYFGRSNSYKTLHNTDTFLLTRDSFGSYINGPPRVYEGHVNEVETEQITLVFDGNVFATQNYNGEGDYTYGPSEYEVTDSVNTNFLVHDYDARLFYDGPGVNSNAQAWYINPTLETFAHAPNDFRDVGLSNYWYKARYQGREIFTVADFPAWTGNDANIKWGFSWPLGIAELSLNWVPDPRNGFDGIVNAPLGIAPVGSFVGYEYSFAYAAVTPDNGVFLAPVGTNTAPDEFLALLGISAFNDFSLFGVGHMTRTDLITLL